MNASRSLLMTTTTKTKSASTFEHVNRLCYGDNLDTLRTLPSESVDLIYLDPPYNSKRVYNCSFGAKAQAKAFDDNWSWGPEQIRWLDDINNRHYSCHKIIISKCNSVPVCQVSQCQFINCPLGLTASLPCSTLPV